MAEHDKAPKNLCKTFFLDTIVLELHSENLFIFATPRVCNLDTDHSSRKYQNFQVGKKKRKVSRNVQDLEPYGHISLKVPNIELDFNVSVDSV